jgi:hypothetical protein
MSSVREFGRVLTQPFGAPAGQLQTFIEVLFKHGENNAFRMAWCASSGVSDSDGADRGQDRQQFAADGTAGDVSRCRS